MGRQRQHRQRRQRNHHRHRCALATGADATEIDALIARSTRVRKAKQLDRAEIVACMAELDGDLDAVAAKLEVSPRGLRLRMPQLGL